MLFLNLFADDSSAHHETAAVSTMQEQEITVVYQDGSSHQIMLPANSTVKDLRLAIAEEQKADPKTVHCLGLQSHGPNHEFRTLLGDDFAIFANGKAVWNITAISMGQYRLEFRQFTQIYAVVRND